MKRIVLFTIFILLSSIFVAYAQNSYWRNDKTGDWEIAFVDDKVVYDCKLWDIISKKENDGAFTITASEGGKNLSIKATKEKNGQRIFTIGKEKIVCSLITDDGSPRFLADNTYNIVDNHFHEGDSVTICGWMRGLPAQVPAEARKCSFSYNSIIADNEENYVADLDTVGRFDLRFPIENTTGGYIRLCGKMLPFFVEPNEKYFVMVDLQMNRLLMMGKRVRLTCEILDNYFSFDIPNRYNSASKTSLTEFMKECDSASQSIMAKLDSLSTANPTISKNYRSYMQTVVLSEIGYNMMQAKFQDPNLPDEYFNYVTNIWKNLSAPCMMVSSVSRFMHDYCDFLAAKNANQIQATNAEEYQMKEMDIVQHKLDSLGFDNEMRSLYVARQLYHYIDWKRSPLDDQLVAYAKQHIKVPLALNKVLDLNAIYKTIESQPLNEQVLKSNTFVEGLTDGKKILQKILEPFKGKLVLLDIWGTWCSPCKENLSHSQEEYAELKPYDVAYVYLANNSEDTSWKNVIKQYNVVGENVAHYNLPSDQQKAVEKYLQLSGYPCYKLFDREGNLVDLKIETWQLRSYIDAIKKYESK